MASGDSKNYEVQVRECEKRRFAAMCAGDLATLDVLLDDELTYTHSSGVIDRKQSYLKGIREKLWDYRDINTSDERIVIRGDAALVFCRLQIDVNIRGTPKKVDSRALAVWTRASGDWRLVAVHSTANPA